MRINLFVKFFSLVFCVSELLIVSEVASTKFEGIWSYIIFGINAYIMLMIYSKINHKEN